MNYSFPKVTLIGSKFTESTFHRKCLPEFLKISQISTLDRLSSVASPLVDMSPTVNTQCNTAEVS